jgi:hypothetical protein
MSLTRRQLLTGAGLVAGGAVAASLPAALPAQAASASDALTNDEIEAALKAIDYFWLTSPAGRLWCMQHSPFSMPSLTTPMNRCLSAIPCPPAYKAQLKALTKPAKLVRSSPDGLNAVAPLVAAMADRCCINGASRLAGYEELRAVVGGTPAQIERLVTMRLTVDIGDLNEPELACLVLHIRELGEYLVARKRQLLDAAGPVAAVFMWYTPPEWYSHREAYLVDVFYYLYAAAYAAPVDVRKLTAPVERQ